MKYEQRPWLTTVPWSQVIGADGNVWTVLPHWPLWERRINRPAAPWPFTFTPACDALVTVLVPDESDALAALAAVFGMPEVLAIRPTDSTWWRVAPPVPATVLAHLRDWHGTLDQGSPHARLTHRSPEEALAYHWQLHQQQLVFPLPPDPHTH